jgi:hypothetical protein
MPVAIPACLAGLEADAVDHAVRGEKEAGAEPGAGLGPFRR